VQTAVTNFAASACRLRKSSTSSSLSRSSVPKPPGTQKTSSCGQSAKVTVGVSTSTESLATGSIRFPDQMHLCAGHAQKHLHRPGEIELGDFRKDQEADLKRSGHGEPFRFATGEEDVSRRHSGQMRSIQPEISGSLAVSLAVSLDGANLR
jgi:hypothetical protein